MRAIELLSPAKNMDCGIAAINHGADAVYIGASQFSARAAAGNSIAYIEKSAKYAHQYRSKVFVALNTLLTDNQLRDAEKLVWQVYEAGADALILQDMGVLMLDLPPIELHASTQTDNRTIEKVKFLENSGFSRVVLARELSLHQITEIANKTDVELEVFVHGALCVSYSGQCYISQAECGRSANRGECAQYCRLPYDLEDANGKVLKKNKYLLSLKDLDLSDSLSELLNAGITSLKIEGRLKDENYVKNITSFYRKKLDAILATDKRYKRASSGTTTFFFEPNPEKSFRRNSTDYFLHKRNDNIIQAETPKSMGEYIGKVKSVSRNFIEIETAQAISNGDGLCFINSQEELCGFRANKVENNRILLSEMPKITVDTSLYRNQDVVFDKQLQGNTSSRKIALKIILTEIDNGIALEATDEDNISTKLLFECEKQRAQKEEAATENIKTQLSKLGNTIFETNEVILNWKHSLFFPSSFLATWRRELIEQHLINREQQYVRELPKKIEIASFPQKALSYSGNVANKNSKRFYLDRGVESVEPAFELKAEEGAPLMFCKHCIKFTMGWCPKQGNKVQLAEPLFLTHKAQRFELNFDCKRCEMQVSKAIITK